MGASFPIWGLLLARVQNIFYFNDTQELRDGAAEAAIRFLLIGLDTLIGYTLQYYCIAQVGQRISTGTADTTPPACAPACLSACRPACLSAGLPAYLRACLSAGLPICLPACWPAWLPACL